MSYVKSVHIIHGNNAYFCRKLDKKPIFAYAFFMKKKINSTGLYIWITENGDTEARKMICENAKIHDRTLWRILHGDTPKFPTRYRIYKLTGIKLCEDDDFPERQEAS